MQLRRVVSDHENDDEAYNPVPQGEKAPDTAEQGTNGDKIVLVMVGLPARGKTYIARKVARYLEFFYNAPTEVFNVGNYRRKQFGATQKHDFFNKVRGEETSEGRRVRVGKGVCRVCVCAVLLQGYRTCCPIAEVRRCVCVQVCVCVFMCVCVCMRVCARARVCVCTALLYTHT